VKALVVDPRGENVLGTLMPLDMIGCEPRLAWNQTDALNWLGDLARFTG
jgi:hypothetical protein